MKIKSKKIVKNEAVYCLTTNKYHNFVISTKNNKGIVSSQCWAGAQALNGFDTYLAPFIKKDNMTDAEVYQCLQFFLFSICIPSRWGSQPPFSNVTLDIFVPEDLKDKNPILGGRKQAFTYGECQPEINRFNKIFFDVYEKGDYKGNLFQYPIPTLNCTKDFFEKIDPEVEEKIYKLTAKFGSFYFSNFINSDMKPEEIRSMCVHPNSKITVQLEEDCIEDDDGNFYSLEEAGKKGLINSTF
jgi:ribonucleoside-triphosphate reductase